METSNRYIARLFRRAAQLMELHEENPFKIRTYETAAFRLRQIEEPVAEMTEEQILEIEGIGETLAKKILEIRDSGSFEELDHLASLTPPGLVELVGIKGIGPKRIHQLWQSLNVLNAEELMEACERNEVSKLKGYGKKTQENIKEALEFFFEHRGKFLYSEADDEAAFILRELEKHPQVEKAELTGEIRRRNNTVSRLDFLVETQKGWDEEKFFKTSPNLDYTDGRARSAELLLPVTFHYAEGKDWAKRQILLSGNEKHVEYLKLDAIEKGETEQEIYKLSGFPYIIPEMREGLEEFDIMQDMKEEDIIGFKDLRGCLHNHSTYSDGVHSIEQMAQACIDRGLEYFGICDHSQSAFYAGGMKPKDVAKQWKEVDKLNAKLKPFRIFKGIESDILKDGSLDYDDDILKGFDFVVASIHGNQNMTEDEATARLIKAVENPYTTIMGHLTGRLLLMRRGYPVNHHKVIDACAANGVAIEINANPRRLDMDWTHLHYAVKKGVMLSINPDAHEMDGIDDMRYGVCTARKAGVPREMILNTLPLSVFEKYLAGKKA